MQFITWLILHQPDMFVQTIDKYCNHYKTAVKLPAVVHDLNFFLFFETLVTFPLVLVEMVGGGSIVPTSS